jgi:DeoR/GlpR family transcriptional regulator of sugar metabolism
MQRCTPDRYGAGMQVNERRRRILDAVLDRGLISLREAAELAGTSEVTARRDIRLLAESGMLRRTHGGAACLSASATREPSYQEKTGQASAEKAQIALAAAALVGDDDAVAIGPGTTTLALARLLVDRRGLTVVTSSLLVCDALLDAAGVQVLLSGGSLRGSTHALVGPLAEQSLAGLHVRTLFVSGNGLSAGAGCPPPTCSPQRWTGGWPRRPAPSWCSSTTPRSASRRCRRPSRPPRSTRLITDDRADPDELRRLEAAGVAVTVCPVVRSPG